ncbi:hypothetical protein ElyMa_004817700 [Elysia marginata]|uniref:Uncharacterized protein n=1 Tax=Elysia marginata TaxID=1093978 RepID=A0AAV4IPX5_9GAST|nr:hypothetical protein ElyMa_004817700 [Elysia marginata]
MPDTTRISCYTNFKVLGLTRPGIEPRTSLSLSECLTATPQSRCRLRGSVAEWLPCRTRDLEVAGSILGHALLQLPWESNLPQLFQSIHLQNGYPATGSS